MGAKANKETLTMNCESKDPTEIELRAEICASWGYGDKVSSLKEFASFLTEKGYNAKISFEPKSGGNGEFFLFQEKDGKSTAIFSNNKKHSETAFVQSKLNKTNYGEILGRIV